MENMSKNDNKNEIVLTEEEKEEIYMWLDTFKFSKAKQSIARDFSDGVLFAEIVKAKYPRMVELHNYIKSGNTKEKYANWETLNRKIFVKFGFNYLKPDIDNIVNCVPDAAEKALKILKIKLELYIENKKKYVKEFLKTHDKINEENNVINKKSVDKAKQKDAKKPLKKEENIIKPKQNNSKIDSNIQKELKEKNEFISDLIDTIDILELKIKNLEQLLLLKDEKINELKAGFKNK